MIFRIGDMVVASNANPGGHWRVPRYVRARPGRIEAVHAPTARADEAARGRRVLEPVYTVAFDACDLWSDADPRCVVHVELWESQLAAR